MSYELGDFSFIRDELWCNTLTEDFAIINNKNLWNALKKHDGNKPFMFDTNWNIQLSNAHSGASHALSLRTFEYIAKNGWNSYVNNYISKNN